MIFILTREFHQKALKLFQLYLPVLKQGRCAWLDRGAMEGFRTARRCARHSVPAAGVAGVARDPRREHRFLHRRRQTHRIAQLGARRGASLCCQSTGRHRSVPSNRAPRWRLVRLPLGCRAQARVAQARIGLVGRQRTGMKPARTHQPNSSA